MSEELENIKTELILKPLNSAEELRNWFDVFFNIRFPMGVVYPTSTHAPVEAAWRIYELIKTGESKDVPEIVLLSSRDSFKTLIASAIEVLCLVHFRFSIAHAAAILSQSEKAVQYANSFFNKIQPYLEKNGWKKTSDSKTKIEWRTNEGESIYLRVLVMTRQGMNCVVGNTNIRTDKGSLHASSIYRRILNGESFKFLSYNHKTKELEYKDVKATQKNNQQKTYTIKTNKGSIQVSGDHKVYVKDVGYIKAKDLKLGQKIIRAKGDRSYLSEKHGKRISLDKIKKDISDFKDIKVISNAYKNNTTEISLECVNHGVFQRKWSKISDRIKRKLSPCAKCNIEKQQNNQKSTPEEVKNFIEERGFKLLKIEEYKSSQESDIKIQCPKNHIFNIRFNNFKTTERCTKCFCVTSSCQLEVYDYIKSIYANEIILNDRKTIKPLEIDIYIPEKKLAIEFDGLYWHSEKVKPDIKSTNIKKIKNIKKAQLNILAIYEDEWKNTKKQKLIKAMIRHRLNIKPTNVVRASKLEIRKLIKNDQFKVFFENYHLDGHTTASFAYGLFLNNILVSCMSFRKSIHDKCWEIARFATSYDYLIHGNASKIVNTFKKEYNEKLITYSNNRLSHGNVYKQLGFKEITKTLDPSYYYTDFTTRLWRFKCRRINDPVILSKYPTEKAQAEAGVFSQKYLGHSNPLYKIYDYGHRKWIKE